MLDELCDNFISIEHFLWAQLKNVLEGPGNAAGFANVVNDHLAMLGANHETHQTLGLRDQLIIQSVPSAANHQLFDNRGQALGENNIRSFGVLVLIKMEQLDEEGE